MIETELAWAAGFFDGEGCTHIEKAKSGNHFLRVQVVQIDRRPLDRFQSAVNCGKVYGPYKNGAGIRFQFSAKRADAQTVIDLLMPYLSEPKQEQALACR